MAAKIDDEPDARRDADLPGRGDPAMGAYGHRIRDDGAVVLFDGDCALCHGAVAFIRARDRRGQLRFVPLRSPAARPFLGDVAPGTDASVGEGDAAAPGASGHAGFDTLYFYENGRLYDRSTAALRIARHLKGLWPLASLLTIIPRALRDPVYTFIARRRHRFLL